jgi:hypothetical protein
MNAHQKYLNHYTQNMKSNNEITKYFLEQEKVSGTIKFAGAFKLKYEMTPMEYRKANKFV